jgi:hypothetical protein
VKERKTKIKFITMYLKVENKSLVEIYSNMETKTYEIADTDFRMK